jgi:DNA primase
VIPDDFKQQLLNRVDIVDVIERHVQLRKAGQNFVGRCPFHSEKTPSFSVSPAKQFYHCFGCGAHGNAISFVMEFAGLGYVDAVKDLAGMVGLTVPQIRGADMPRAANASPDLAEALARAARFYKDCLKRSETAIDYLRKRGLTGEIAARFGLGYAPAGWQSLAEVFPDYAGSVQLKDAGLVVDADGGRRYDRFRDRIMFPIHNARGTIIGFGGRVIDAGEPKYLNSPETLLFEKGRELYGLFQARQALREAGKIVVVEGYMDVVALAQHGIFAAVATLGTATTPMHIEKLLRLTDEVVFCFDGDQAGRRAAWRALEVGLGKVTDGKRIGFLFLPEKDDPDSFVRAHGRAAFEDRLSGALPLSEFLTRELSDRFDIRTPEGRARLLHLAKPLVTQIVSAPALALMLRRRLAELAHVELADVDELFEVRKQRPMPSARGPAPSVPRRTPATLTRWVLQALLAEPELAHALDRSILDPMDRFLPAIKAVLDLIDRHPGVTGAEIVPLALDVVADTSVRALLDEALGELMAAEAVNLKAEFAHVAQRLAEQADQRRLTYLRTKPDRTGSEQAEFEQLLSRLSQRAKGLAETLSSRV